LRGGIKTARDQARNEASEGRPDLVRARREKFARQPDDARARSRERFREFKPRAFAESAAARLGRVFPRDAEEIERMDVIARDAAQAFANGGRQRRGIAHLREGRDADAPFAAARGGFFDHGFVEGGLGVHWLNRSGECGRRKIFGGRARLGKTGASAFDP